MVYPGRYQKEVLMKAIGTVAMIIGIVCLIAAVVSRISMTPIMLVPGGLEAGAILAFANTCLLISIVLILSEMGKK